MTVEMTELNLHGENKMLKVYIDGAGAAKNVDIAVLERGRITIKQVYEANGSEK